MHQAFLKADRADVILVFGMRERLIDVKKLYAFCLVVKFDSLPTGDLAKKGGSGKAPQHQHRVAALGEVTDVYRPAHIIEDTQIR